MTEPEKGDFIFIQFDPQAEREQTGFRPGIVLSPKSFNEISGFACNLSNYKQSKRVTV